jgi:small subunit ribosomal protein S6
MPIELYETMYVLDAGKMSTEGDAIKTAIHGAIEKQGGEIVVSRPWNENQKLAYPIKKQKKGYFHIVYYKMESTKQAAMESDLRLTATDYLLRHLTSNVDHRYAEVMLQIAREEQGSAFALRGMKDEPSPTDITPAVINDPGAGAGMPDMGGPVPNLNGGPAAAPRRPRRDAAEKPE